ncbi:DUF1616 domain-containing protein [Halorussus salinisoli]|uniref:DUF1616 domain-containing protein n=1 Tax=Halorussus salinisoli TaxID=2558242 RepID=UPI0010C24085|nr:DUF1616 domain-containing protein [Halorussus salinisoli]
MSDGPDSPVRVARRVPLDLLAAVALALLAAVVLLEVEPGAPLSNPLGASPVAILARVVTLAVGLPLLLFLPGYAAVAVVFPGHEPAVERIDDAGDPVAPRFQFRERAGIDAVERVTLAVGVSAAVTPATALALNFTPMGLYARPLVVALAGFTVLTSLVAAVARLRLPAEARFAPTLRPEPSPVSSDAGETATNAGETDEDGLGAANVVLAVGVLVAVAGIGFAVAVPKPGQQFTELYLLSENENGTLVADDFPAFAPGEQTPLVVGVENHEGRAVNYSLVVELQRVETTDDRTSVRAEERLHRTAVSVAAGETERVRLDLAPPTVGPDVRLRVMLFEGPVPADPTAESAYRYVDLWLNDGGNQATTTSATAPETQGRSSNRSDRQRLPQNRRVYSAKHIRTSPFE